MKALAKRDVAELFGLPYEKETPHPEMKFLFLMERTEVAGLVDLLHFLLTDLGEMLSASGHRTFAHFILDVVKQAAGSPPKAAHLEDVLATELKGLQDMFM